jgi:DNA-binding NarL/FixJ family response regulator
LIRVLVADDHSMVREGIRHVLVESAGFQVVAEASNGDDALALATQHRPDVAVLDISMPGQTGLQVAAKIREGLPGVQILILSMHEHTQYALEAVRAGAHGYLLKDTGPAEMREAVRTVHGGEPFFSPTIARQLTDAISGARNQEVGKATLDLLTARERDVLVRIADGRSNKEIAADLRISPRTVETHRLSLMKKLDIRTVAGLTRFAIETGLSSQ